MNNLEFDTIVIVDDNRQSALHSKFLVDEFDVKTDIITDGSYKSVEQLLERVLKNSGKIGVICDHRLTYNKKFANFLGSEFIAKCYDEKVPGLLLSQYIADDIDISIRKYRRWNPVTIPRHELTEHTLIPCFEFCSKELSGTISSTRKPYRTLIEITGHEYDGGEELALAVIPGWNPESKARFPFSLIKDETIRRKAIHSVKSGDFAYFFAQVNIGAKYKDDLFFDRFEWAEEPTHSTVDTW